MLLKPLLLLTSLTLTLAAPQNKGRPWSDGADDISADSNRDFKREDTHWRRGDETDSVRITGGEAAGQGGYYVEADSGWNPKEKRDSVRITGEGEEGPEKGHEWGRKKRDDSVRITGDEDGPEEGSEWSRKKRESRGAEVRLRLLISPMLSMVNHKLRIEDKEEQSLIGATILQSDVREGNKGSEHMIHCARIDHRVSSLQRPDKISRHPLFSKGVKSIFADLHCYDPELGSSLVDLVRVSYAKVYNKPEFADPIGQAILEPWKRIQNSLRTSTPITNQQDLEQLRFLQDWQQHYRQLLARQDILFQSGEFARRAGPAIAEIPFAKTLIFSDEPNVSRRLWGRNTYSQDFVGKDLSHHEIFRRGTCSPRYELVTNFIDGRLYKVIRELPVAIRRAAGAMSTIHLTLYNADASDMTTVTQQLATPRIPRGSQGRGARATKISIAKASVPKDVAKAQDNYIMILHTIRFCTIAIATFASVHVLAGADLNIPVLISRCINSITSPNLPFFVAPTIHCHQSSRRHFDTHE
ncbi:hypothetical protein QBC34DRAFT_490206 [Podospora aff. communis PSN243]|uniref:Uncharacterized protein n=1 Tax=Podospora aff. communis PSN243 TaxID=3040156 RepID=A0AAV9H513_9PEZI|nr:hypothetical protein QBC34DRAFT_490206 [Podospora aff. communis PSN243]